MTVGDLLNKAAKDGRLARDAHTAVYAALRGIPGVPAGVANGVTNAVVEAGLAKDLAGGSQVGFLEGAHVGHGPQPVELQHAPEPLGQAELADVDQALCAPAGARD